MIRKLLFLNQTLGMGGAEVFNSDLLNWLADQKITIISYSTNAQFVKLLKNAKKIPLVIDFLGNWKGLVKGLVLLPMGFFYYGWLVYQNRQVDVLFMTGYIEKILASPWAKLFKLRVVWEEFGPVEAVFNKFGGLPKKLYQLVMSIPEVVIVPSQNTKKHLESYLNMQRLLVIPCARDVQLIKAKIKREACCVSRLEKGKGQDILIQAWAKVCKVLPQAELSIVGEGAEKVELEREIEKYQMQKNITLTGRVENSLSVMAASAICVFPSIWELEGFGLVAIEAMALGKPVVGFARGPLPEIVDEKTGILTTVSDDKLAKAILDLLKSQSLQKKLGSQAREKFAHKFTFGIVGPQYLRALNYA